jgi:GT2 family glycosyltransferase
MLVRREVIDEIGYLDEIFFAYQEDADYCLRTRNAGWQVYYYPAAKITHFGGQGGSRVQPYRSILAWHKSYFFYYRKHFAADYFFLFNGLYYTAMGLKLALALAKNALSKTAFGGDRKPG